MPTIVLGEQDQADAVAAMTQQLAGHRGELNRQVALEALRGAPVDRRADVDDQPDVQAALVVRFAHDTADRSAR